MKKIVVCLVGWSLTACQPADHVAPSPGVIAPAGISAGRSAGGPAPKLTLKHYLALTGGAEITLAEEQARVSAPMNDDQKQANRRLLAAFDPTTFRLNLGPNGRYTVNVEYRRQNRATALSVEAQGDVFTRNFSATVPQLGLQIDFVCLMPRGPTEICDPQNNALVTFRGMDDFAPFEGARFSFLYQSAGVSAQLAGSFKYDYLGRAAEFTSGAHGQLLVIDILNPFTENPEQIRLDLTSSHGDLRLAAKDQPGATAAVRWDVDKEHSTDPYKDSFVIADPVTASYNDHFKLPLAHAPPTLSFFSAEEKIEFTLERPLL